MTLKTMGSHSVLLISAVMFSVFFKWKRMLLHLCCGAPSANETLVRKSTAMSLSGNCDPVTGDNPQTLL